MNYTNLPIVAASATVAQIDPWGDDSELLIIQIVPQHIDSGYSHDLSR
jgi:hypothetical protein